ncbi:2,3-diaminopropionate biosynthesis protein SbnB [Micromonospora sp. DT229]|uniref:2,3-diaminopropionate biosynthesis protein SbnB n=1 Tax=Micromonospora sp. DT229 TaxID=3393430 RepID=UPI003CFADD21
MTPLRQPPFTVLSGPEVAEQIEGSRPELVTVVRRAYLAHAAERSSLPHSSFLRFAGRERDRIIALPGFLDDDDPVAGIKWISSFPGNREHGLARASAVLLLNDMATGYPQACMEASIVSATRTAASAVLGAEALVGDRRAARIGFIGTGLIAGHVHRFLRDLGWRTDGYLLHDVDPRAAHRFAERALADGVPAATVLDDGDAVLSAADLVVLATVASTPHLTRPESLEHRPVVLHLSLRDLAPDLVLRSQNITDDTDHAVRERTSLHLTEQQVGHRRFVDGTLADVIEGRLVRDPDRPVLFSPFGLGVLDLAVGRWVHRRVVADGGGHTVPDFFAQTS